MTTKKDKLMQDYLHLQKELKTAKNGNKDLEEQNEVIQLQREENDRLHEEIEQMKGNSMRMSFSSEIALPVDSVEIEKLEKANERLLGEKRDLEQNLRELSRNNKTLKAEIRDLEDKIEGYESRLKEARSSIQHSHSEDL